MRFYYIFKLKITGICIKNEVKRIIKRAETKLNKKKGENFKI